VCSSNRRRRWPVASLLAALLLAAPVAAEDPRPIDFEVTVVHVSSGKGGVEANDRARWVDRIIGPQIKYDSLRVLDFVRRQVPLDQIGSVKLPSGKRFRFRPMDLSDEGVLVAVDVEHSAQGDFRIPRRKPFVFGGQRYQDGQLVIILEPDY
jgi:hypothetical protein